MSAAVFMTRSTTSSFRPWHLFVLTALVAATIAILVTGPSDPVDAVLLTLAIGAASLVGLATYRAITPLTQKEFQETTVMVGSRSRAAGGARENARAALHQRARVRPGDGEGVGQ